MSYGFCDCVCVCWGRWVGWGGQTDLVMGGGGDHKRS